MNLLNERSLAGTIDAVSHAHFFGNQIPPGEAGRVAHWLVGRQGLPGSYAGMFAPTAVDYAEGFQLFTGERIASHAATGHILGEEACRALLLLNIEAEEVMAALARAGRAMDDCLTTSEMARGGRGFF